MYLTGAVCCFSGLNFCFIVLSLPLCWYACFKITRFIHHANHIKDDYLRYLTIRVMIYSINYYQFRRAVNQRSENSIYLSGGKRVSDLFKYRSLFSFYERWNLFWKKTHTISCPISCFIPYPCKWIHYWTLCSKTRKNKEDDSHWVSPLFIIHGGILILLLRNEWYSL